MATSRSGAGGKIVTNRRKQRIASTPYDRPPPRPSPPKIPNWFSGVVVPSALAIASGAGKILSSIFSESGSSSSEDEEEEEYDSEDHIVNVNLPEIQYNRENTLNEEYVTSSEMVQYKQESQLSVWRSETKKIIEQLIIKETFSREECDTLIKVLNSRVMDWSMDAGEKGSVAGSPGEKLHHEDVDIFDKAVQEAKRWFQEKKVGVSSVTELAQGTSYLNPATLEHVETGGGSPVDVARSYMKAMPPWASSGSNIELETPLTVSMKLFQEGTFYSAGHYSTSSSKNRRSFASGSWDIQEELRRVRSRATEDMLRSPTTKTDPSHIAVARIRMRSPVAGEEVFAMGERMTEPQSLRLHNPIDALVHSGVSSLAAFESRRDGKASEALSSKPDTSVSGNNEVSEAVQADAECPSSKLNQPLSPNHAEELHSDLHFSKVNCSQPTEVTKFGGGRESANGLSSSQVSLSTGVAKHDDQIENHKADTSDENPVNIINEEGNCELLSEALMASGSQNSLGVQYEERSLDIGESSPTQKHSIAGGKQQGRKPTTKCSRKGGGRGK